jgi:hypothetical protein
MPSRSRRRGVALKRLSISLAAALQLRAMLKNGIVRLLAVPDTIPSVAFTVLGGEHDGFPSTMEILSAPSAAVRVPGLRPPSAPAQKSTPVWGSSGESRLISSKGRQPASTKSARVHHAARRYQRGRWRDARSSGQCKVPPRYPCRDFYTKELFPHGRITQ